MSAGIIRAAYTRKCKKRKRLEEIIVVMYPHEQSYMPNDSVNIEKHIKTYLLNTCVIRENAKLKKITHHKHLRQLALYQLKLYTIIIKHMNTFERVLLVIHLVMPTTYVIDYGILMI
jgi:hypothetical protein